MGPRKVIQFLTRIWYRENLFQKLCLFERESINMHSHMHIHNGQCYAMLTLGAKISIHVSQEVAGSNFLLTSGVCTGARDRNWIQVA